MAKKTVFTLIAGSFLLLGCTDTAHYPITGNAVGPNDQVKFMTAPGTVPRF